MTMVSPSRNTSAPIGKPPSIGIKQFHFAGDPVYRDDDIAA
jgi:hypothetical protein